MIHLMSFTKCALELKYILIIYIFYLLKEHTHKMTDNYLRSHVVLYFAVTYLACSHRVWCNLEEKKHLRI